MKTIAWNSFNGFYVVSKSQTSFNGLKFHYWAETVEECERYINLQNSK